MTLTVYFENRDFTPYTRTHWDRMEVEKYSKSAEFGPKRAYINAYGSEAQLWEFLKMLRCPVYISDSKDAERKWWGLVYTVNIFSPSGFSYGLSLDSMANNVAAAYTYQKKRYTTDYSSDAASVAKYGQKDHLEQGAEISTTQALQLRNTTLEALKEPLPLPSFGSEGYSFARLECHGWEETLDWRYYLNDAGLEEYWELKNNGAREIGEDSRPIAAQSFQLSSTDGWTPTAIWLRVAKIGSPTDNLLVDLYDDSSNHPNASITGGATALDAATVTDKYEDYEFTIDTPPALATGTTYWIHISRSGAVDGDNHCMIGGNRDMGYEDGELKLWNGASWAAWNYPSELNFRVVGEDETTSQIANCISSVGAFFVGTNIINASGVYSMQQRDGDATALYEIKKLLSVGTTNSRRLLARVMDNRILELYEEPAKYSDDWYIDAQRNITDANDRAIHKSDCTVAKWVRLKDVVPANASVSGLADPSPFFIEEAEYNALTDEYRPIKMRGAKQILSLGVDAG